MALRDHKIITVITIPVEATTYLNANLSTTQVFKNKNLRYPKLRYLVGLSFKAADACLMVRVCISKPLLFCQHGLYGGCTNQV